MIKLDLTDHINSEREHPADRLELALSLVKLLKDLLVECRGEVVLTERAVTGLWFCLSIIETELSRALSGVEG